MSGPWDYTCSSYSSCYDLKDPGLSLCVTNHATMHSLILTESVQLGGEKVVVFAFYRAVCA